ncbi:type VII secretion integral membrane protein EccD [uncultured Corynebacterium sp.]|uniref:type VII secretion integral membrane protein EccD n=1 Tax=uncultured Corynebacterium sp. TaxID=159447 RepID=UPI0025970C61|nr:type VII secretion integral membrane protein EccD [uncultured Corynebacterium sp.]
MVAASAHHIVRVTVRVDVVSFHRDVDLVLPTSSTLNETFPEIARLIELPTVHRPWQATTAAGAPVDMNTPLYQLKLRDGSVLVLRPQEPPAPPVVRDAAESLAAAAGAAADLRGLDVAASAAGCAALAAALSSLIGPAAAAALAGVGLLVLAVFSRSRALFVLGALCAAAACGGWVAGAPGGWASPTDPALGVFAAAGVLSCLAGLGALFSLLDATSATTLATASALACAAAGASWLPSPDAAPAAAALGALLAVAAAPGLATRTAGLKIPRIPTAGEELSSADGYQSDVDERAERARRVVAGILLGAATVALPALCALAWSGRGWPAALCYCVLGAVVVHAARHHYRLPRASLTAIALCAVVVTGVAASRMDPPHPAGYIAAGVVGLVSATAVAWVPRVPELEPTTVVWFERAEAVALIAVLPLAAHVAGVVDAVRGL